MAVNRFAAIEIAAQEIWIKVYEISQRNGIKTIDHVRKSVPIGQDTYVTGRISADMLDRICEALNSFHRVEKEYRVEKTLCIATGAVREAKNCAMVLDQIEVRTGFRVLAMSNSEQRFLRLKGVAAQKGIYEMLQKGTLLIDVGAGSLQVSIFDKMVLMSTQNISLGIVRIGDLYGMSSGDTAVVETMVGEQINNDIQTFEKMFLKEREIRNIIIVGEGGISYIRERLAKIQEPKQNTLEALKLLAAEVAGKSQNEISRKLEIPIEYAGLVAPMLMVYQAFLDCSHAENVVMPKADLCDGYILDYAERKGLVKSQHDFNEDILAASRNISRRYMANRKHAQTVEAAVCQIFDVMKKIHGLGARERLLLQISAILHDCGKFISMSAPGECAYSIIMATEILGLSHAEREMVANIVRYNTLPMPSYEEFEGRLDASEFLTVVKLAAILRVGNALDCSHKQKFAQMKTVIKDSTLVITTSCMDNISLEKSTLDLRNSFFEEIFGIRLQIKQKKSKTD